MFGTGFIYAQKGLREMLYLMLSKKNVFQCAAHLIISYIRQTAVHNKKF